MSRLILGIDGGGTKTDCILFNEQGKTIDILQAGGSNLYVFKEKAVATIIDLIDNILEKNKLGYDDVDAYGIGVAGISDVFQRELLIKELDKKSISKDTLVLSDIEVAYNILCPNGVGVLVNIGTGIICFSRNGDKTYRTAGQGHDKGDIGSGYWLGKELFSRLILNEAIIEFDKDLLEIHTLVLDCFKKNNLDSIYKELDEEKNIFEQLSKLGKETINIAENGNDIALSIIQEGTRYVSEYIIDIVELSNYTSSDLVVAINGSVIKNKFYRKLLNESLSFNFQNIKWITTNLSPAYGAGILAANYKKIDIDSSKIILNVN